MRTLITGILTVLLQSGLLFSGAEAWETYEHQQLGDSAYAEAARLCDIPPGANREETLLPGVLWNRMTFGELCAQFATDDFARNRFHEYGKTILDQLRTLTAAQIDAAWEDLSARAAGGSDAAFDRATAHHTRAPSADNVIQAYLVSHLLALRMAESSGAAADHQMPRWRRALVLEAMAQGYLADAFSAGHILTPVSDRFAFLHPRNTKETHNFHRSNGVYVINSRGDAWQTFGDRLMLWYAPTYQPALEASRYSLLELMAVFHQSAGLPAPSPLREWLDSIAHDTDPEVMVSSWLGSSSGDRYYSERRLPTLELLPMPVAASWSYRTQARDRHGIRRRQHFPQLLEKGLHDPDPVGIDREFLYPRSAVPDWMVPPPFVRATPVSPDSLIQFDPDWASVRWFQDRHTSPSYKGLLWHTGGQTLFRDGDGQTGGMVGVGYGLWDDLLLIKNVSVSIAVMPSAYEPRRLLLVPSAGFGVPFSIVKWLKALRIDGGPVFGLRQPNDEVGGMIAIGIDSRAWPIRSTNAAFTFRVKYQRFYLDDGMSGPGLELILH